MASNFHILTFKTKDSLHIKLDGDFDGSSAYELINTIMDNGKNFYQVFIDTNELRTVHEFGKNVLQKNLGALKKLCKLVFIGEYERSLGQN